MPQTDRLSVGQVFARTWLGWLYAALLIAVTLYFYSLNAAGQNNFANDISTSIVEFETVGGWLTMISSAFLTDGYPYFWIPVVAVPLAGCQWRVGAWWALLIGFVGNFVPTLIGWVYSLIAIADGRMAESNRAAQNYGVSYVALGLLGALVIIGPKLWVRITAAVTGVLTIVLVFAFSTPWNYTIWMHIPALGCGLIMGWLLRGTAQRRSESNARDGAPSVVPS